MVHAYTPAAPPTTTTAPSAIHSPRRELRAGAGAVAVGDSGGYAARVAGAAAIGAETRLAGSAGLTRVGSSSASSAAVASMAPSTSGS
ncbi:MAG: hypothetical protein R2939_02455 [Kofleriaceae bacterium]